MSRSSPTTSRQQYPKTQSDYEIPNAMVGYERGYGEVDNFTPDNPSASYTQGRLLVMAAVKHALALVAAAEGPKVKFTPKNPATLPGST